MENEGRLRRTHGGAIPVGKAAFEEASTIKQIDHIDEKRRIAQEAAKLVDDGDTIALDIGTTTLELAKCLSGKQDITAVTVDLKIALILEEHGINVIMIGGVLRRGYHCAVGSMAMSNLSRMNVDKAFMAANAFSVEKGFTTPAFEYAEVKKAMIAIASETIMLTDSSKIGKISFLKFADLADLDRLIVDDGIGKNVLMLLKERAEQLELHVV
jgi:DeoR family fructose operon transcriptional repressor